MYSPVFSYKSLRTIFAIAADSDLRLDQWDLKNSFIQQQLDVEHMYIECPDGYSATVSSAAQRSFRKQRSFMAY